MKRRTALVGLGALFAGACSKISESRAGQSLFDMAENWHLKAHRALANRQALAPEFAKSDISPVFKGNGSITVDSDIYRDQLSKGFPDWRLRIGGLVKNEMSFSLENLRTLPQRTQITRHDCVEGWSAIGEWTGPQLSLLLDAAEVLPAANFIVFYCADILYGKRYYESVDMVDAYHPQTIVAHALNGEPLPEKNGAPLRMRIERQLGYKHPKYLTGIEAVASLDDIEGGKGGFWEDNYGYQWYAGM
ncbi:MAG: molybdopterin-binding protein [Altererythrobacter sp.]|jgi:DMSO/TMAO reductase YedYZ molybdopterin-dependent catalytic subunit|uniref:molybdopterin-dependent oxidoreductase n=1 Tax=uncultured Altererythrobacter sp. TaxID=500840 RepID=UPI000D7AB235|nr:molybdopterin-dependent oxidoreductase [uncultured Altererythrobacter sp.]NBS24014.1 molybdopterin-binding protein [Altererythrobacter sp.]PWL26486.1 MAG: molybdopterin-binding protein [Altererythrobacter sp. XM-24bin4]